MAHTYRNSDDNTMAFRIKRMPPHSKLLSDARDRETRVLAQMARKGDWRDDD